MQKEATVIHLLVVPKAVDRSCSVVWENIDMRLTRRTRTTFDVGNPA